MNKIINYIDEKLQLILSAPHMWGGEEALEPLIIALLMIRNFVAHENDDERQLMREYRNFLANSIGGGNARLIDRLKCHDKNDAAVAILRRFVERQKAANKR